MRLPISPVVRDCCLHPPHFQLFVRSGNFYSRLAWHLNLSTSRGRIATFLRTALDHLHWSIQLADCLHRSLQSPRLHVAALAVVIHTVSNARRFSQPCPCRFVLPVHHKRIFVHHKHRIAIPFDSSHVGPPSSTMRPSPSPPPGWTAPTSL
ncbi:uncharacterized protein J3D65DRAFT_307569 [Phyllosticta citribraziliensis]|uniref:Uncharacterized protein n=1 Tax=Phyllosticta citribraziliensis TaxID=989973 RepID=A0ABR1LXW0_9PEZI